MRRQSTSAWACVTAATRCYHAGHPCEIGAPLDVCLTFGNVARSLAEHGGYARLIDKAEAMDALQRSYDHNLVQIGENVRENPAFICNCCGCCCEALQAARNSAPCSQWPPRIISRR